MIESSENSLLKPSKCKPTIGVRAADYPFKSEYKAWKKMKERCYWEGDKSFRVYGGSGVVICDRWRNHFQCFLDDMGPKPTREHSVDRENNSGSYTCGQCSECQSNGWKKNARWATRREQTRNTSRSRIITAFGRTKVLIEWAEETGINADAISARIKKGWSPEMALSQPVTPGVLPKLPISCTDASLSPLKSKTFGKISSKFFLKIEGAKESLVLAFYEANAGYCHPGPVGWSPNEAEPPSREVQILDEIIDTAKALKEFLLLKEKD